MASPNQVHLHNLKDFLKLQTPDVLGLIWVDQSIDRTQEAPFSWLNYLFNGTLELQISHQKEDQGSLFVTDQYGHNYYLGITSNEDLSSFLKQFVETTQSNTQSSKKITVMTKKDISVNQNIIKDKTPYELEFVTY